MEVKTLEEWRIAKLFTQSELARRAGVAQSVINRIEAGEVNPRLGTIRKICEVLEVQASQVKEFEESLRPKNSALICLLASRAVA